MRWFKGFLFGGLLGTLLGIAVGIFVFPYIFPPPEATETLNKAEAGALVAKGSFVQPNPNDPVHTGKGDVSVYSRTVFLGENFEVGPGPDFHVYLVPKEKVRSSEDVKGTMFIDLGRLRSFKGSQKYSVPHGIDLKRYSSVVIWCEEFGVLISPADLAFQLPDASQT